GFGNSFLDEFETLFLTKRLVYELGRGTTINHSSSRDVTFDLASNYYWFIVSQILENRALANYMVDTRGRGRNRGRRQRRGITGTGERIQRRIKTRKNRKPITRNRTRNRTRVSQTRNWRTKETGKCHTRLHPGTLKSVADNRGTYFFAGCTVYIAATEAFGCGAGEEEVGESDSVIVAAATLLPFFLPLLGQEEA